MNKKLRFEVFKRDDFTCQYCGRKVPQVVLEVDHIIPRVEGGGDEQENLTTSCFDCNRGKGRRPLDRKIDVEDLRQRNKIMREREEQLRAYDEVKRIERERIDKAFTEVWNYWFELWGATELPRWYCFNEGIVRRYLRDLPVTEVKEAMDIAVGQLGLKSATCKYFGGVLRKKLKQRQEGFE